MDTPHPARAPASPEAGLPDAARTHARPPAARIAALVRLAALLLPLLALLPSLRADAFDLLRQKWVGMLTGGEEIDPADADVASKIASVTATADAAWSSLNKAANRDHLWSDAARTNVSADIHTNFGRLRSMALAYATKGSPLRGSATLRDDILSALDWMYARRYNENVRIYDNWWHFEIGAPMVLNDTLALMHDALSADQLARQLRAIEKFTPSATTPATGGSTGTFTGANRMWKIQVVAIRGILARDSAKLAAARDAFSQLFLYVTSGDGFYADGSFIQHGKHPYTGGYGASLLSTMAQVLTLLNGPLPDGSGASAWRVVDSNLSNVFRWIYEAYEPLIYRGGMMAMTQGREASRSGSTEHGTGHGILHSILHIAQFAPPADSARMRAMVKGWALADTSRDFTRNAPLPQVPDVQRLLADHALLPREEKLGCTVFASMDRVVHLGLGFGFGLSMSSSRIYTYESINSENLKGWHTGDGMLYLYNADLTQFTDAFWPTVNPRRLPGTTVDASQTRANASGQSIAPTPNWVGGASLGRFGAAGMQLDGWNNSLVARKSWFFCDDEVVCLGAGISSSDHRTIETTIENRMLGSGGRNAFTVDGVAQPAGADWSATLPGVRWMHLAGRVADSDVAVWFPAPTAVRALREARTGAWSDINTGGSTAPLTRHYLTAWLDHGADPSGAAYAYVLLPGRTAAQAASYAARPHITVLANTEAVQAVRENTLSLTAATFWNDTPASAGEITVDRKACVLLRRVGDTLELAVSDPTQANTGAIAVEIALSVASLLSADTGVTVTGLAPTLRLSVSVAGARGRTFRARFALPQDGARPVAVLGNLSTRAHLPARGDAVFAGFVIEGGASKRLLLRAVGPTLGEFGLAGTLQNPRLTLTDAAGATLAENDNWGESSTPSPTASPAAIAAASAAVGAFALPAGSRDAALLVDLKPGLYSAIVRQSPAASDAGTGIVLVEVYDAAPESPARLVNLSSRVFAGSGAQAAIVGFTLTGALPRQLLVRAAGPALAAWGVAGVLADPRLEVVDGDTRLLARNDNWDAADDAEGIATLGGRLGAFALPPAGRDAATLATLGAGTYTALLGASAASQAGTTGNALVEIYAPP